MHNPHPPHPLLIICGPTATGKTKLALQLAKAFRGELISADSRQVYQGMDIVTGKDIPMGAKFVHANFQSTNLNSTAFKNYRVGHYLFDSIPVWGLDLVTPDQPFDVSTFIQITSDLIQDISRQGKLPILVGGTGFYLRSLLKPQPSFGIPTNSLLRQKLEQKPVEALQIQLKKIDPRRWGAMNNSDRHNSRRLIRAIEIALHHQTVNLKTKPQSTRINQPIFEPSQYGCTWLGLTATKEHLQQRIYQRVITRMERGAEAEVKALITNGYSWDLPSLSALGYREWREYIDHRITKVELGQLWALHELQYAKRQMTWFNKEKEIHWFELEDKDYLDKTIEHVRQWLGKTYGKN